MSSRPATSPRKVPVLKLLIVAVALGVGAVLVLRGFDLRGAIDATMAFIRNCGAAVFFTAMAVLPAVGMPMALFALAAGEAFASQISMPGVIVATMVSLAVSIALGYWLARYALRPLLLKLLARFGYSIPTVDRSNALSLVLFFRLTPGTPFCVQNFILGIAGVPFKLYFIASWLAALPYIIATVVLGKGILEGNFRKVGVGIGAVVAAVILVQWLRRRYVRRPT